MAEQIAKDLSDYLDEFHKYDQPYDDKMDAEFYEQYARILREQAKWGYFNWKTAPDGTPRPTFGPSSAGKSERELYQKSIKSKKDEREWTINQRDWVGLGGSVGGYIQREIMLAERHFKKLTGKEPRFKFERTERNEPAFEHFKKAMHEVEHDGEKFAIHGLPDGILEYVTDDGEILRVGLEVKSFQKGWSAFKAHKEAKEDHVLQTVCYSDMYGLDYVVVLYHLTYGVDWFKHTISRNKIYGVHITDDMRDNVKSKFARVTKAWRTKEAPPVDLFAMRFNDYRQAIAESLSDDEFEDIKAQTKRVMKSGLPEWKKQGVFDTYEFFREVREAAK